MNAREEAESALAELLATGGKLRLVGEKVIVDWHGARVPALAARLRAAKPELRKMMLAPDISQRALRVEGTRTPDDHDMRERLNMIDAILNQRDERGRIAFTQSQVESCAIGLRSHAGTHSAIDSMLARLVAAKKSALSWRELARRRLEPNRALPA